MKKTIILLILIAITSSCNYKIISPFDYDINDAPYNDLHIIDANATEVEIKYALDRNKEKTGKNIIVIEGYIKTDSKIFQNLKNALKNESKVILDLSKAFMENTYNTTLENALFLQSVYFGTSQKIVANFFKGCSSLESVVLSSTLETIDDTSFTGCDKLKKAEYLGTSPNTIKGKPFSSLKNAELYLPNVPTDPKDKSWNNFLGAAWAKIHYGKSMPK